MANHLKFSQELWDRMLAHLRAGKMMTTFYAAEGLGKSTVRDWRRESPELTTEYKDAKLEGSFAILEEVLAIADTKADDPACRKVRIYARFEYLKRRDPERFSEKVRTELTGRNGGPVETVASFRLAPLE